MEPRAWWVGPGLGARMSASRRAHADEYSPDISATSVYAPSVGHSRPLPPPASPGDPPRPAGRSGPDTYQIAAFALGPGAREILHAPFMSEVSISPSPPELLRSSPLLFKAKCSQGSSSRCQTPRLGSVMWGSELSFLLENLCSIIIPQFVSCQPRGVWDLIIS